MLSGRNHLGWVFVSSLFFFPPYLWQSLQGMPFGRQSPCWGKSHFLHSGMPPLWERQYSSPSFSPGSRVSGIFCNKGQKAITLLFPLNHVEKCTKARHRQFLKNWSQLANTLLNAWVFFHDIILRFNFKMCWKKKNTWEIFDNSLKLALCIWESLLQSAQAGEWTTGFPRPLILKNITHAFLYLIFTAGFLVITALLLASPSTRREAYALFTEKAVISCRTCIYYQSSQR